MTHDTDKIMMPDPQMVKIENAIAKARDGTAVVEPIGYLHGKCNVYKLTWQTGMLFWKKTQFVYVRPAGITILLMNYPEKFKQ